MPAVLLPNGKQQFIDINGAPLVGGTVGMYLPATLTTKNTWQDSGQTILNTNPVVLDSRGQALIYGVGPYRQIVRDSLGNLIWDQLTNQTATIQYVANYAALYAIPSASATSIQIVWVETATDTGSVFVWDASNSTADNGYNIIKPSDESGNGRWVVPGILFPGSPKSGISFSTGHLCVGATPDLYAPADDQPGIETVSTNGNNNILVVTGYGTGDAVWHTQKANGTVSSPTAPVAGDNIGSFGARAYDDATNTFNGSAVALECVITQNATGLTYPATYFTIETSASNTRTEAVRVTQNRAVLVNYQTEDAQLVVNGQSATPLMIVYANPNPGPNRVLYLPTNGITTAGGESAVSCCLFLKKDATYSRSLNAAGTVNASGADYADYETKRPDCGEIAKGAVCGYDADGYLTDRFSLAVSFGIKSTDPSFVGGDTHLSVDEHGHRPHNYGQPQAPKCPKNPGVLTDKCGAKRRAAYPAMLSKYQEDKAAHDIAMDKWRKDHDAWEAHMSSLAAQQAEWDERANRIRSTVDRIAKAGRVPCIVSGDVFPAGYIIAAKGESDTIIGICSKDKPLTGLVGIVRTANPDEARLRRLVSKSVPYNPAWNALVEVIQS